MASPTGVRDESGAEAYAMTRQRACRYRHCSRGNVAFGFGAPLRLAFCVRPTDLTLSCAAKAACRSRSGAAVAANEVQRTVSRSATAVTPSRWRRRRQLGCRAEVGPHQLQREVSPPWLTGC